MDEMEAVTELVWYPTVDVTAVPATVDDTVTTSAPTVVAEAGDSTTEACPLESVNAEVALKLPMVELTEKLTTAPETGAFAASSRVAVTVTGAAAVTVDEVSVADTDGVAVGVDVQLVVLVLVVVQVVPPEVVSPPALQPLRTITMVATAPAQKAVRVFLWSLMLFNP